MVSRETIVHVCAVALAVLLLVAAEHLGVDTGSGPAAGAVLVLFYGLVLGGAHLYLAVRGEDGLIPVGARWRYVATLAVCLGAGGVIVYAGDRTVAAVELRTIAVAVAGVAVVGYGLAESVAGYRASRPE